jgi:hypothetical protein
MFGMLVYEALTGNVPFHQDTPSVAARRILEGQRPPRVAPAASVGLQLPGVAVAAASALDALWALHDDCTAFVPAQRPALRTLVQRLDALILEQQTAVSVSGPEQN